MRYNQLGDTANVYSIALGKYMNIQVGGLFAKALAASVLLWGFSFWQSGRIPSRFSNLNQLQQNPLQTSSTQKPFEIQASGHTYQIQPIYDYELWGLVVSDHSSDSWMDNDTHESWGDFINTKDICVIWGQNVLNPNLSKISFRSGAWTCYAETKDTDAWRSFRPDQLSNNHVIPANDSIGRLIANSNVGDEIRIRGHLVNYKIDNGPSRNSSIVRTDMENGACEIIYVNEFETYAKNNKIWFRLANVSKWIAIISLVGMIGCFFVWPFFIPHD